MTAQTIVIILLIGLMAGILSGLVGVGGGILIVPALVFFMGYTQHQAQGTSLGVLTLPVVVLGFLKYYFDSKKGEHPISLPVIGLLATGFFIGGYFGSSLALKIDKDSLRKIFGLVLLYTAIRMLAIDTYLVQWWKQLIK